MSQYWKDSGGTGLTFHSQKLCKLKNIERFMCCVVRSVDNEYVCKYKLYHTKCEHMDKVILIGTTCNKGIMI